MPCRNEESTHCILAKPKCKSQQNSNSTVQIHRQKTCKCDGFAQKARIFRRLAAGLTSNPINNRTIQPYINTPKNTQQQSRKKNNQTKNCKQTSKQAYQISNATSNTATQNTSKAIMRTASKSINQSGANQNDNTYTHSTQPASKQYNKQAHKSATH